ncbi:MAG: RHS repeat protein [Chthoniobacterales bacterium]|nr:RHS repeat protein [Chthoniobacterales bacterium]
MKTSLFALLRSILLAALCLGSSATLFAQGTLNPTGVAGVFNGNSNTGCSYDPYTANATRTIPDIVVSGAVGAYPLVWARTMNSRGGSDGNLGAGGGWRYSYQWSAAAESQVGVLGNPPTYTVHYPDGRVVIFSYAGSTIYPGPLGVRDRFQGLIGGTGPCYLLLADGGKIRFQQTASFEGSGNNTIWDFVVAPPDQIIDPNGLVTALAYDATKRLTQVTEPAGRWLKVYYVSGNNNISHVDAGFSTTPITQSVTYVYGNKVFGSTYNVLLNANYSDNTSATYGYQAANNVSNDNPLIKTCADVRYPGPMKNILYGFKTGGSYGQLYQEKNLNGNVVTTLAVNIPANTRTETRGDGPSRTWTYGATVATYLLKSSTDFLGHTTALSYDPNGFVSSIQDPNQQTTLYTHLATTGVITKITHPVDNSTIQYFYDPTGYHLTKMIDELNHTTIYTLNPDMTMQEIDYPDGGIETFQHNGYAQVTSHTMVSNTSTAGSGGIETFTYDTGNRGLLVSSYPPITGSDPSPSLHPTKYHYDGDDHLDSVTDPRANITTLGHNERGQLTLIKTPDLDKSETNYAYNNDGTLSSVTTDLTATLTATTRYTYDDYKRVLTQATPGDSAGNTTNTTHF